MGHSSKPSCSASSLPTLIGASFLSWISLLTTLGSHSQCSYSPVGVVLGAASPLLDERFPMLDEGPVLVHVGCSVGVGCYGLLMIHQSILCRESEQWRCFLPVVYCCRHSYARVVVQHSTRVVVAGDGTACCDIRCDA